MIFPVVVMYIVYEYDSPKMRFESIFEEFAHYHESPFHRLLNYTSLLESDPDWRGSLALALAPRRLLSEVPLVVAAVERPHVGGGVVAEHAAHHACVRGAEVVVAHRPPDALVPVVDMFILYLHLCTGCRKKSCFAKHEPGATRQNFLAT